MSWIDANKEFLVAAVERLAGVLESPAPHGGAPAPWPTWSGDPQHPPAIERLAQRFALTTFERDLLLLAAALELDGRFATLCARAAGGGPPWPTFRLALGVLPGGSWDALLPSAPLRRWELVRIEPSVETSVARLSIDERIWNYLLGLSEPDPRFSRCTRPLPVSPGLVASQRRVARGLARTWADAMEA